MPNKLLGMDFTGLRRLLPAATAAAALLAAWAMTWKWAALGDYPQDAGPAIDALLHGHLREFFHATPSMGPLSLYLRLPFAALSLVGRGGGAAVAAYRWGALLCVASAAVLGTWLAAIARARGTGPAGQLLIALLCVVNPLVESALTLGHPEELLTAVLAVGALVAAVRQQALLTAVLLGLALACKQWAVLGVLPTLLALDQRRVWVLARACALAVLVMVPQAVGSPSSFLHGQLFVGAEGFYETSNLSWLWPVAPSVTRRLLIDGHASYVSVVRLSPTFVRLLHPLICLVGAGLAAGLWRRSRGRPELGQLLAVAALIWLVRCALDNETMPYYHAALFLSLVAWDALAGERLPLRGMAAAVVTYVLFDRLVGVSSVPVAAASYAYGGCAAAVALALAARALGWRWPGRAPRLARAGV